MTAGYCKFCQQTWPNLRAHQFRGCDEMREALRQRWDADRTRLHRRERVA